MNHEIAACEDAVVRADRAFSVSIQQASAAGRGTIQRTIRVARPALIGVSVLAIAGLGLGIARHFPTKRRLLAPAPAPPSGRWSGLTQALLIAFAAAAGRRLVESWLQGDGSRSQAPKGAPALKKRP